MSLYRYLGPFWVCAHAAANLKMVSYLLAFSFLENQVLRVQCMRLVYMFYWGVALHVHVWTCFIVSVAVTVFLNVK